MSGALTFEKLQAAIKALKMSPMMEGPHIHLVHPKRWTDRRVRWLVCIECFARLDKRAIR